MTARRNPFEYAGANDLPNEMILDYYIEDFNYSRFIQSKRNVILAGERGCGKSMTLLYNSWALRQLKAERDNEPLPLELIGVYIPCNTPLTHKEEYELLDNFRAGLISEHHLVLSITYRIAETLAQIPGVMEGANEAQIRSKAEFIFNSELPHDLPFFEAIKAFVERENLQTQRTINNPETSQVGYDNTFTFSSIVVPILGCAKSLPKLKGSHFMLMIDDAHDLNRYQIRALNSWIAYRDHSVFSLKVALANVARNSLRTSSGGSILEGHDYTRLDMMQPYQNEASDFGRLAKQLVGKRLRRFSIEATPDEFFPISDRLRDDLQNAEDAVRQEAIAKYGQDSDRIADYIYKYKRAYYFRNRPPTANRPEYSGFDTLVFLSTGVIRNLLQPCYWMYEKMLSLAAEGSATEPITAIPPQVQSDRIVDRSRELWDWLRHELDQNIEECSREDAVRAYHLLDNLAVHFRERLLNHKSEPRANSFTISGRKRNFMEKLEPILRILQQAQLVYIRSGPAKEKGRREWYYVPNRMLWPERGLDPHGQHARVSLSAADLWAAADENRPIPLREDATELSDQQRELFDV
jgi:hypothetical protein